MDNNFDRQAEFGITAEIQNKLDQLGAFQIEITHQLRTNHDKSITEQIIVVPNKDTPNHTVMVITPHRRFFARNDDYDLPLNATDPQLASAYWTEVFSYEKIPENNLTPPPEWQARGAGFALTMHRVDEDRSTTSCLEALSQELDDRLYEQANFKSSAKRNNPFAVGKLN